MAPQASTTKVARPFPYVDSQTIIYLHCVAVQLGQYWQHNQNCAQELEHPLTALMKYKMALLTSCGSPLSITSLVVYVYVPVGTDR